MGLNDILVCGKSEKEKSREETEWLARAGEEYTRKYQENQGQIEFKMAEWLTTTNSSERERKQWQEN